MTAVTRKSATDTVLQNTKITDSPDTLIIPKTVIMPEGLLLVLTHHHRPDKICQFVCMYVYYVCVCVCVCMYVYIMYVCVCMFVCVY